MTSSHNANVPLSDNDQVLAVFTQAADRFMETLEPGAADSFLTWLETHSDDDELLAHLVQTYPKFGEIFTDVVEKIANTVTTTQDTATT